MRDIAYSESWIVGKRCPDPNRHRIVTGTEFLHFDPRLRAGNPFRGAAAGRDPPVKRERELEGYVGQAGRDVLHPWCDQCSRLVRSNADVYLETSIGKPLRTSTEDARVGIETADDHAAQA
jgi:hypothetical protein